MNGLRHFGEAAAGQELYFRSVGGASTTTTTTTTAGGTAPVLGLPPTKAKTDSRLEPLRELYQLAKVLFDFICPPEYGISDSEKVSLVFFGLYFSQPAR